MRMYILLSVMCLGCGQDQYVNQRSDEPLQVEPYIDPTVKDLVAQWDKDMSEAGIPHKKLMYMQSIAVTPIDPSKLGICIYGARSIEIQPGLSPQVLKAVVYHELGHCVLNQAHWGDYGDIMYPALTTSDKYWTRQWNAKLSIYIKTIKEKKDLKLSDDLTDKD